MGHIDNLLKLSKLKIQKFDSISAFSQIGYNVEYIASRAIESDTLSSLH